jgi:hypothetical protein
MGRHLCDLILFIKRHYLYFLKGIDESVSDFYIFYSDKVIDPLSPRDLGFLMRMLDVKLFRRRVGDQIHRYYQISYDDLEASLSRISNSIHIEISI